MRSHLGTRIIIKACDSRERERPALHQQISPSMCRESPTIKTSQTMSRAHLEMTAQMNLTQMKRLVYGRIISSSQSACAATARAETMNESNCMWKLRTALMSL